MQDRPAKGLPTLYNLCNYIDTACKFATLDRTVQNDCFILFKNERIFRALGTYRFKQNNQSNE